MDECPFFVMFMYVQISFASCVNTITPLVLQAPAPGC